MDIRYFRVLQISLLLAVVVAFAAIGLPAQTMPVEVNENHVPAGVLHDGVLEVQLEIAKGEWHPEADDGMALSVYAFGEAGRPLQNPGPLIRVAQGTEISASLHNTLAVPINVHGLGDSSGGEAIVHIEPQAVSKSDSEPPSRVVLLLGFIRK